MLIVMIRDCLECGMPADVAELHIDDIPPTLYCLKCDSNLFAQTDGSCLTRDIAHQRETVMQAMDKLDQALLDGWESNARSVRLIVGGGAIRQEVLGQLHYYQQNSLLRDYAEEAPNHGAIMLRLRT